nr:hypothetical protein GCM10020093_028700 [Planobispora longispora]
MLFIEVSGCLPMCGHGTIGVATVLVETGMVEVAEPVTAVRLDTPAGLVTAEVRVEDGAAVEVTITNVASYSAGLDRVVKVPGFGEVGYDLAYGGNFYAIVGLEALGLPYDRAHGQRLLEAGLAIMEAINEEDEPVHPLDDRVRAATTSTSPPPARTPGTPGTPWPSTPAGSTARPAARAPAPGWPSCTPAASSPWGGLRQRVVHRHPVHRQARRGDVRGRAARGGPADHRTGVGDGHRPVLPRPPRPLPRGLPPVTGTCERSP